MRKEKIMNILQRLTSLRSIKKKVNEDVYHKKLTKGLYVSYAILQIEKKEYEVLW